MARFMSMMVVFFLALILTTKPAKATDCMSVLSSIFPCTNFLGNHNPIVPETQCCDAASNLIGFGDVNSLCQCFQPFGSAFLPSKAQQLPYLCNLNKAFSPLVKCLAPSLDVVPDGLLPPLPLVPLPPLPLDPLTPLPFFPLPPLPWVPFSPLPFVPLPPLVPPVEQQQKNVPSHDVVPGGLLPPLVPLPPLPLVPLPPLPNVPLPPLPWVPLPPLPNVPLPPLPLVPPVANLEQQQKNVPSHDVVPDALLPPLIPLPPLPSVPLPPLPNIPLPPLPLVPPVANLEQQHKNVPSPDVVPGGLLPPLPSVPLPPLPSVPLPPLFPIPPLANVEEKHRD